MRFKYNRKLALLLAVLGGSGRLLSQEDNYSLESDVGLDAQSNDNAPIGDFDEKSSLFENVPSEPSPSDSKSTIVRPPKAETKIMMSPGGASSTSPKSAVAAPSQKALPGLIPSADSILSPAAEVPPSNITSSSGSSGSSALPQPGSVISPPTVSKFPASVDTVPPATLPSNAAASSQMSNPVLPMVGSPETPPVDAPLTGDGTLAPVKFNQPLTPNEFGGVPPLPGTRREMAPGEAPELYSVEEGDTMFDVCSQLIDDGNYWPKLWSLNPDVKNPHFIYPGMKLAFYSGDHDTPPYLEVVTDDEMLPLDKGPVSEAELVSDAVTTEGREGASVPAPVRIFEEETPTPVVGPTEIGADSDGLDGFIFAGKSYSGGSHEFTVPAFYFLDEKESLGEVVGGLSGEALIGDDGKVFVAPEDNLSVGTYTVLRPSGSITSLRTGDDVGYRYEFAGNLRLTRKTTGGLMEGTAFGTRGGIHQGDIVVSFIATRRSVNDVSAIGPVNNADSSIIGFEDAGKRSGGMGDLVFLEKTGLSVGSYYSIYRTDIHRDIHHTRNDDAATDGGSTAIVKVIEINGEAALGKIVLGKSEVRVGDSLSL